MVSVEVHKPGGASPASPPLRRYGPAVAVVVAALVLAAGVFGLAAALGGSGRPGPPPASVGIAEDRALPASVLDVSLVDQHGFSTSLSAFRGKIVVFTPFLSSCQETCPITTGAFLQMRRDLGAAGLGGQVVLAEVSVDPSRDTPSRLAAYAHLTGTDFPLLTGKTADLDALWHYFGIYAQKVPEGNPPGIDWQSGAPYSYDVNHSDGFIVLDRRLHSRFVTGAAPKLGSHRLGGALSRMLSAQGRQDLNSPPANAWTIPEGLQAIGWVAGRAVPSEG
jgi:protein SCO1/2